MITTTIKWFDPREKLPEEHGWYLVYTGNVIPVTRFLFVVNLSDFDEFDFPGELYSHQGGFVDFDDLQNRWLEYPLERIKYWAKMPEIKEEN